MTKKRALALLLIIICVAAVAAYISSQQQKLPATTLPVAAPTTQQSGWQLWQGVLPGISFNDLIGLKGAPKQSTISLGSGTMTYPGTNQYWDTTVTIQNNSVEFIQEHVFKPQNVSLKSRLSDPSAPPVKIYGPFSESGQYVFAFPESGIAFLANPNNNTVYEVWYFKPSSIEELLSLPEFNGLSTNPNNVVGGR